MRYSHINKTWFRSKIFTRIPDLLFRYYILFDKYMYILIFRVASVSGQQIHHRLRNAVRSGVERPFFDYIIGFRRDTQSVINSLVQLFDLDRVLHGFARALIGRFPIYESFLYSTAEHQNGAAIGKVTRSEEHTSELQSLMRISYAVLCLKKKK